MGIVSNAGKTAYGIKAYVLDTVDDLVRIDPANLYPGSTAFIIDSSTHYMLNNKKVWMKVDLGSGSGGGGTTPDHITYDGGVVIG